MMREKGPSLVLRIEYRRDPGSPLRLHPLVLVRSVRSVRCASSLLRGVALYCCWCQVSTHGRSRYSAALRLPRPSPPASWHGSSPRNPSAQCATSPRSLHQASRVDQLMRGGLPSPPHLIPCTLRCSGGSLGQDLLTKREGFDRSRVLYCVGVFFSSPPLHGPWIRPCPRPSGRRVRESGRQEGEAAGEGKGGTLGSGRW